MTTVPTYPNIIRQKTTITPTNIFEIGASDGSDAEFLRQSFGLPPSCVFCFEPNPQNFTKLTTSYPTFNSFRVAVSNSSGKSIFYCHGPAADVSSLKKRTIGYPYAGSPDVNYKETTIDVIRMDEFIEGRNISHIDICKIDTEGFSYAVLDGFGNKLSIVKCLHVEAEKIPLFDNPTLFNDVSIFLSSKGFTMIDYIDHREICDSVWARNDLVKLL